MCLQVFSMLGDQIRLPEFYAVERLRKMSLSKLILKEMRLLALPSLIDRQVLDIREQPMLLVPST